MICAAKETNQLVWLRLVSGATRLTIFSSELLSGFEWMCHVVQPIND